MPWSGVKFSEPLAGHRDSAIGDADRLVGLDRLAVDRDHAQVFALVVLVGADQHGAPRCDRDAVVAGEAVAGLDLRRLRALAGIVNQDPDSTGLAVAAGGFGDIGERGLARERPGHVDRHVARAGEGAPDEEDRQDRDDRGGPVGGDRALIAEGHRLAGWRSRPCARASAGPAPRRRRPATNRAT